MFRLLAVDAFDGMRRSGAVAAPHPVGADDVDCSLSIRGEAILVLGSAVCRRGPQVNGHSDPEGIRTHEIEEKESLTCASWRTR